MANLKSIKIKIKIKAWVKLYLKSLSLFCYLTGFKPNIENVKKLIKRGVKIEKV